MKILILSHAFYPAVGGIETVSELLAVEFSKAGHEVRLMTWTRESGDQIFPFPITRNPDLIKIMKEMRRADVIFENNPCIRLSWPNLFLRKRIVTAVHTWIGEPGERHDLKSIFKRKYLSFSNQVIACSAAVQKTLTKRAIVIANPYQHGLFRRKPEISKTKDFVFLGRLVSDKGLPVALRAFKLFCEHKPGSASSFTIIGSGEEKVNLLSEIKGLQLEEQVKLVGGLRGNALVDLLNEHRYLLVPSIWEEPFGLVALEGMACGCIPIVAAAGGLPEAVGNAGLKFKKGDVRDLFEKMLQLNEDPELAQQLAAAAEKHLSAHHCSSVSQQYLEVFKTSRRSPHLS